MCLIICFIWPPLFTCVTGELGVGGCVWLPVLFDPLSLPVLQVNWESVGVYRVQYSSESLDRFLPAIRDKTLPPRDRLGLQSDLFALVSLHLTTISYTRAKEMILNEYMFPLSKFNGTRIENRSAWSKSHLKIRDCLIDYLKSSSGLFDSHMDTVATDVSIFSIAYRLISTK